MERRCRNCAMYDLKAVLSKNGRVLPNRAALCLWESREVYPLSVTRSFTARRPSPSSMEPNDGADCECFTPTQETQP